MKVAVLLADGFETLEGLTVVDIMRRADVCCHTFGTKSQKVRTSHNIVVEADKLLSDEVLEYDVVVLPGGMPGAVNLRDDEKVNEVVMD
ncbi:DJ-1/PfpI family protein, partial [Clostridium saudiense]|nr:DJ-1/PfpI family protein [Clostridium saudiense]